VIKGSQKGTTLALGKGAGSLHIHKSKKIGEGDRARDLESFCIQLSFFLGEEEGLPQEDLQGLRKKLGKGSKGAYKEKNEVRAIGQVILEGGEVNEAGRVLGGRSRRRGNYPLEGKGCLYSPVSGSVYKGRRGIGHWGKKSPETRRKGGGKEGGGKI